MSKKSDSPLVSIITPSFNQAAYLEATIRSVLDQDYPNVEYIVVDGGSSDDSLAIIQRFEKEIAWWVSEPDQGQADAINRGFARAKGEIVAWLNSDDVYCPGAISAAVAALQKNPDSGFVYAKLDSIDQDGTRFNTIAYQPYNLADLLSFRIIGQPSVFMRKSVLQKAGQLDLSYHYLLDHQLWIRLAQEASIVYVPEVWAAARHHSAAKNVAQANGFGDEALRILDWAKTQPDLLALIDNNQGKVQAGVQRLVARYLLDASEPWESLKAYSRAFLAGPSYTLQHAGRIIYALLSLLGFGWLRRLRSNAERERRPILVTGLHRSGTSWVGRSLTLSGELAYVSEPLNVLHRPGVMAAPVEQWYSYITEQNEAEYLSAFEDTLVLRYKFWKELASLRSPRDFLRMLRDSFIFLRGRLTRQRVLLKDPFALFSAVWVAQRLDAQVVIVLRHPAAFVSSLKRLNWSFDFNDLLAQPALMRDHLEPFRQEMESAPEDLVGQASLLWRIGMHTITQMNKTYPELHLVQHEELSKDPVAGFRSLFRNLGLPFTSKVERSILRNTGARNPDEVSLNSIYNTNLDSAANLQNWKRRLSADEIVRIRQLTQQAAEPYYGAEDWA